jgi:High potential iron-sulfur protein
MSRRQTLRALGCAGAAAALPRYAAAAEPRLDPKDPAAVAAGYVESAARADTKKYSNFVKGSSCENCAQLQGAAGAAYRPCAFFQGKLVAVGGWCSAWTPEI